MGCGFRPVRQSGGLSKWTGPHWPRAASQARAVARLALLIGRSFFVAHQSLSTNLDQRFEFARHVRLKALLIPDN
jgi:hypothetical protein